MKDKRADFLPVSVAMAAGLMLSILVFLAVRGYYQTLDRQQFQRDAASYGASLKADVERHVTSLAAIQAFVSASHGVTRWEFSTFAHQILPQNSGFKAVLWVPRISGASRRTYEAQLQSDGLYGLRIREISGGGALVSAGDRPSYLPVGYVEPFEGNGDLIGLDFSTDPVYARLFATAAHTGRAAASPPVTRRLIEGARGPVVLIAFPLDSGKPGGAAAGYALGVLQLDRIVADTIDTRGAPLQGAIAYGAAAHAAPVMLDGPKRIALDGWFGDAAFHQALPFDIAGQHFFLALRSADHPDHLTRLYAPLGAALLVIALTSLLVQNMLTTTLRKRSVERAVVVRTAELRAMNQTLSDEVEQRRQAEAGLRVARDKAEGANRAKSAFLATMSHELRTPLNAIIGFSSLLLGNAKEFDVRSADYMGEIHDSGVRLLDLINDVLDLVQMDSGNTVASSEPVYLSDCIAAVIAKAQPQAEKAGVALISTVPDGLPFLRGDGKRLQKALLHLVSNAVKFTGSGGKARIAAHANPDQSLTVEVRDNGPGMPPRTQALLFEAFSQHDSRLARNHEGVGLGLVFVQRVAELHQAAIHISSKPGEGTIVSLTFPPYRIVRSEAA